jgi:hypothetical protein
MAVETLEVVADLGYYDGEELRACKEAGITVTLPKPLTSAAKAAGRFGKQEFIYVVAEDIYIPQCNGCPRSDSGASVRHDEVLDGSNPLSHEKAAKVATEMALNVLAYNMKRMMMIVGVVGLVEAMQA